MSAIADSVSIKLVCNVHVWAYFKELLVCGKTYFLQKMTHGLGQNIICIIFLVVSDFVALFK